MQLQWAYNPQIKNNKRKQRKKEIFKYDQMSSDLWTEFSSSITTNLKENTTAQEIKDARGTNHIAKSSAKDNIPSQKTRKQPCPPNPTSQYMQSDEVITEPELIQKE
ncbi:13813_t:CDS:2, partial [Cetraspora pellucida]